MVPEEPTEKMVEAGVRAAVLNRDYLADEGVREIYRAMVEVAISESVPLPPQ